MGSVSRLSEELVAAADRIARALRPPCVARVMVPPPSLEPDEHGTFCGVQLADGSAGLAYILLGDTRQRLESVDQASFAGRQALELAEGFTAADPATRSLGLAALNALTRHLYDRARFRPDFAVDSLGSLKRGPGERLGMVGLFPPLVRRAREEGTPLTVLELKPDLVQEDAELTVTLDPTRLSDCNQIVCTSTVLLNDSLDGLLASTRGCQEFAIIGPSAGCLPDPLFTRGVTSIGGSWVVDSTALLERIERGERWGDAARKFSVRRDAAWPGLDELLRRAA
jgi:uncharacterized protein